MHFIHALILCFSLISITSQSMAESILKDIQGQSIPFSTLKGKWVFINYWAGWCQTCLDEIPEFNRFYHSHLKDPVALYAVNYDALPAAEQNALISRVDIRYPSLLEDPGHELNLGDIRGVPVTFIFNPQGKLVETLYGGQTAARLNAVLTKG